MRGEVRFRFHGGQAEGPLESRIPDRVDVVPRGAESPVPAAVEGVRVVPGGELLLQLSCIRSRTEAESFRGAEIWAPRSDLPPPGEGECYAEDLLGIVAVTPAGVEIGKVREIYANGAQDVLVVATDAGDVDVPFVAAHVGDVDLARRRVVVLDIDALRI